MSEDVRAQVASVPYWYHTLQLAPGVVTPGHFDLRDIVHRLPWPDVEGRRCLDVATFDGFYAFEMERRGAAEVVAVDIADTVDLDWLPRHVPPGLTRGHEPVGLGFRVAAAQLASSVRRVVTSVYDLAPADLGTFDVVVCGALLLHLRDPFGALEAIRSVCDGWLLSVERVDTLTSLLVGRYALQRIIAKHRTWTVPNIKGHVRMLHTAGFDVRRRGVVAIPYGRGYTPPPAAGLGDRMRHIARDTGRRLLAGAPAPPFSALAATPSDELQRVPA